MYKLKMRAYFGYFLLMVFIYLLLMFSYKGLIVAEFDSNIATTFQIIVHNLTVFLKWQVFFIFSPFYWIFETLVLSWTIKTGIVTYGFWNAFEKLWRHGILEIPIMFL